MSEPFTRNLTDRNQELLQQAETIVYREAPGGASLEAHVFFPRVVRKPEGGRPAILFFFSGDWDTGTVSQFAPQCMHFSERGVVAMAVDYRLGAKHGTTPLDAMEDARTAIRWVRANADYFGVNPQKIVASGGSAGAHLAVMAALLDGVVPGEDDTGGVWSCRPDGLVLFSPIVDISKKGTGMEKFADAKQARAASPLHVLKKQSMPPTILFHSADDRRVPIDGVRRFAARMKRRSEACELHEFAGVDHSFFNFNVDTKLFDATVNAADAFLVEAGLMEAEAPEEV